MRICASVLGMSLGAVQRAVGAMRSNREPGQLGAPRLLKSTEEDVLLEEVTKRSDELHCISKTELMGMVG